MSQKEAILNILSNSGWHCTNEFYASYIADPRTRLCELAKSGVKLEWRWCQQHPHKKSKEWRLQTYAEAEASSLPKPQALFTYKPVFACD